MLIALTLVNLYILVQRHYANLCLRLKQILSVIQFTILVLSQVALPHQLTPRFKDHGFHCFALLSMKFYILHV